MRRKLVSKVLIGLLAALFTLILFATPVLAISVPDSGPFILQVDVYRHLLEDDDMLIHVRYNVPYDIGPPDTAPEEAITQAMFGRLMDDLDEVARTTIYSYYRRGWGYGSFSMYLNADLAAGLWETDLTVELRGSPTLEWTGDGVPLTTTAVFNWRATTSQTASRLLVYSHMIAWSNTLGDYWNVALVTQYAGENKLSSYGEAYFTTVIPGLRAMVPQLFSSTIESPEYTDIDYSTAGAEAATDAWPFDFGGISEYFGMPSDDMVLRTLIAFVIIFVVCAVMVSKGVPTQYALFGGFALLFVLAVPGLVSFLIVGAVLFIIVLLTGAVFLLRRS